MKEIVQTNSRLVIKSILSIEDTYDNLVYDNSPALQDFNPDVANNVWLILLQDGYTAGIIMLEYINSILWTPHIIIYKKYRGKDSEEWGALAAKYMKEKYGAKKFLAFTPYISAKKYAEKIGFKQIGILTKSIKKNGELLDQYMLEMN